MINLYDVRFSDVKISKKESNDSLIGEGDEGFFLTQPADDTTFDTSLKII